MPNLLTMPDRSSIMVSMNKLSNERRAQVVLVGMVGR